jgi:uncharacterized protein (DUF1330 family)
LKAGLKAFGRGVDMKKGYWVIAYRTIGDEATMNNYVALAVAAVGLFGARLLVGPKSVVTAREAGLKQMTVVVEFDSYEIALAAYESAEYKKALAALGPSVERGFRIAERGLATRSQLERRRFELRSNAHSCGESAGMGHPARRQP